MIDQEALMCDEQGCLTVQRERVPGQPDRVVIVGAVPKVERFSTLLLAEDSPSLRFDGTRIEIRASDRTLTYEVTGHAPAGRPPSDDDFVTARLIEEAR